MECTTLSRFYLLFALIILLAGIIPASWALSCRHDSEYRHLDQICAFGSSDPPQSTNLGCCCPVNVEDLRKHFGAKFANGGANAGFCKFAESAELAQDRLERKYKTRCDAAQAAQLYNSVCTSLGQAAAGVETVGRLFTRGANNFADNTASADCKSQANGAERSWSDSYVQNWLSSGCPCGKIEKQLPDNLRHCIGQGYCIDMMKRFDLEGQYCDHGNGVRERGFRASAKYLEGQRQYHVQITGIEERAAERRKKAEEEQFLKDQPLVHINHDRRSPEQIAVDKRKAGQKLLSGVHKCCGPLNTPGWTHCSETFRNKANANYDDDYCKYYYANNKEAQGRKQNLRSQKESYSGEGSRKRHDRKEEVREMKRGERPLTSLVKGVMWKNMFPSSKQLQSLISDGIVAKRSMGKYKPGDLFGQLSNLQKDGGDYDSEGWKKLEEQGFTFEAGFKIVKPDGAPETRLPCMNGVCYPL